MSKTGVITTLVATAGLAAAGAIAWNRAGDGMPDDIESILVNGDQTAFTAEELSSLKSSLQQSDWYLYAAGEYEENAALIFYRNNMWAGFRWSSEATNDITLYFLDPDEQQLALVKDAADALLANPPEDFLARLWEGRNTHVTCINENFLGNCIAAEQVITVASPAQENLFMEAVLPGSDEIQRPRYYLESLRGENVCYEWGYSAPNEIDDYVCDRSNGEITEIAYQPDRNGLQNVFDFQSNKMFVRDTSSRDGYSDDYPVVAVNFEDGDEIRRQFERARAHAAEIKTGIATQREHYAQQNEAYWQQTMPHLNALVAK